MPVFAPPAAQLSDTPPLADGVATAGTGVKAAREDHVHPAEAAGPGGASFTTLLAYGMT